VIQRLANIGLHSAKPIVATDPSPSFFSPIFPSLLAHLNPPPDSPLPPYPEEFLPQLFLALPTSNLIHLVVSLVSHLAFKLGDGRTNQPNERIKRADTILSRIIGPPKIGGEAWDAIMRGIVISKAPAGSVEMRIALAWISTGGETCTCLKLT
jgi:telomere length regulation protein